MIRRGGPVVASGDLPLELANAFASCALLGWDIETSGLDWRSDRIGTCQVFAAEIGAAVVSLSGDTPVRLAGLLENPRVEKVIPPRPVRSEVHGSCVGGAPQGFVKVCVTVRDRQGRA